MRNRLIQGGAVVVIIAIGVYLYWNRTKPENLIIHLSWHLGSFIENEQELKTGLAWALSSLGAELPKGSLDSAMTQTSSKTFLLDLSLVGFSESAASALQEIVTQLKSSSSYQEQGHSELGRLLMLTLNSSYHYYEITGVPKTLEEFKSLYQFEGKTARVINSAVSKVQRKIEVAEAERFEQIAYISVEGLGTFQNNDFTPEEFEVMDFMPNGQLRFALYDKKGRLKQAADHVITNAGKPSKCLWCHETTIQPFFTPNPVLEGPDFLSAEDFLNVRNQYLILASEYKKSLKSDIDYGKKQDHAFMEKIYLGFMEPSASQLALEWELSLEDTEQKLLGLATHTQEEFKHEGLYVRADVDVLAPYEVIRVPDSPREFSKGESNFFSAQK